MPVPSGAPAYNPTTSTIPNIVDTNTITYVATTIAAGNPTTAGTSTIILTSATGLVVGQTIFVDADGAFGADDNDSTDPNMFTSQGNSLDYDAFTGASTNTVFMWGEGTYGVLVNWTALRSAGQETHGTSS